MRIASRTRVPGGYEVTIEYPNATTKGDSRFETVAIAVAPDATPDEVRAAVVDALRDPIGSVLGEEITAKPNTRLALEPALEAPYERWQRWKATRIEAQARSLPAGVITALTNREDSAWAQYLDALTAWRNAT